MQCADTTPLLHVRTQLPDSVMASKYSKGQIRRAGNDLAAGSLFGSEKLEALKMVGHWRAAHIEPLRKTLAMLEEVCDQDESTILVSRLKRIDTIINKLSRPGYNFILTTLRDIAGCRLIVQTDDDVRRIAKAIQSTGQCRDAKDYMLEPKQSGYRGIHLVCRHNSESYDYENLDVEVQVRSRLQHDWATAVEIYDMITGANLKFDDGSNNQRRYFQLASALMSHDIPNQASAIEELKALDEKLSVLAVLRAAMDSMYVVYDTDSNISRSDSCLITVDIGVQQISLEVFTSDEENEAADKYTELESNEQEGLVYLLARAGSLEDLRRAYPNYYSDISEFVDWLASCIG